MELLLLADVFYITLPQTIMEDVLKNIKNLN
jgi:hypothetical protein